MATSASARNGRDSNPQYLGVKAYDGQLLKAGSIIAGTAAYMVLLRLM